MALLFASMRVLLADPPAYTPPYDRSLAAALALAGADVELVTSRFRFGAVERPRGYDAREWFYPLSSRMGSSRARLAVKALEHPFGMVQLAAHKPDVLHLQWFGAPEADRWLFRPRSPVVFTAHDIIPRRTAARTGLWRSLFARCDRIVVHSQRGRDSLASFGVPAERCASFPTRRFARTSTGGTTAAPRSPSGSSARTRAPRTRSRPSYGSTVRGFSSRATRACRWTGCSSPRATARSGASAFCPTREIRRALSEATVALFPYRSEIDVSGALLQVLGAGVPAIVYDIGGLGEVIGRFGAGAVVEPGDVGGMALALERLLGDPERWHAARAGRRGGA